MVLVQGDDGGEPWRGHIQNVDTRNKTFLNPMIRPMNGYWTSQSGFGLLDFPTMGFLNPMIRPMNGYWTSHSGFGLLDFPIMGFLNPMIHPMNG